MPRPEVPAAEALLGQALPVLDRGFVRLIDYLGGDARIVQSARVSYGEGTKTLREDKGLIHYLYRNAHTSPFEQVQLSFHCKLPIFVARQWIRHRTARLNELSARYSVMRDEFYVPDPARVQYQSADNKQGSGASMPRKFAEGVVEQIQAEQRGTYQTYSGLLEAGMARELARLNLPLSLYTEWYWQIDLHNLFHFLRLRLDPHAQFEIRAYAEALALCAKAVAPLAYEAFEEYGLHGANFSRSELRLLRAMLRQSGYAGGAEDGAEQADALSPERLPGAPKLTERRRLEFVKKLWGTDGGTEAPDFKPVERGE